MTGHRRLAGKDGVGKTTLVCAAVLRLAQEPTAKPLLFLSCDSAHSLSDCLRILLSATAQPARPGLFALELDATTTFMRLKQEDRDEVRAFFTQRASDLDPPFDREATALLHVPDTLERGEYRSILPDTDPSGYLLRWLALPELMTRWPHTVFRILLKYRDVAPPPKIETTPRYPVEEPSDYAPYCETRRSARYTPSPARSPWRCRKRPTC